MDLSRQLSEVHKPVSKPQKVPQGTLYHAALSNLPPLGLFDTSTVLPGSLSGPTLAVRYNNSNNRNIIIMILITIIIMRVIVIITK